MKTATILQFPASRRRRLRTLRQACPSLVLPLAAATLAVAALPAAGALLLASCGLFATWLSLRWMLRL